MEKRRTVFFGPFLGELGWEMVHWHGWVRKVCRTDFRDHHRIASSVAGREPLYPDVDEFWPIPETFLAAKPSGHSYFTNGWRDGLPGRQNATASRIRGHLGSERAPLGLRVARVLVRLVPAAIRRRLLFGRRGVLRDRALKAPDIEPLAEGMLAEFKRRLPPDAQCFVPWKHNVYAPQGLEFGIQMPTVWTGVPVYDVKAIPLEHQVFEPLKPTAQGRLAFERIAPGDAELIAVFPRHRVLKRSDKNWPRENYEELVVALQRAYPELTVAIFGEPGGAHFADGVPKGCLDLINVDPLHRLDIQLAALERSVVAVGAVSGALEMAEATGCPAVQWGYGDFLENAHRKNVLGTPLTYLSDPEPTVALVLGLTRSMIHGGGRYVAGRRVPLPMDPNQGIQPRAAIARRS